MNKLKLLKGLIHTYSLFELINFYIFNRGKYQLFNLRNGLSYLIRVKSRDFNTINENEIENNYTEYLNRIKEAKIVIDVGANIGCFSIECAKKFKNCQVYSYEPFIDSFDIFNINLKINNLNNVSPHLAAVTSSNGVVDLGVYDGQFEANSIGNIWGNPTRVVKTTTFNLNKIFLSNKIKYCDLLKLDCEGSEYEILENINKKDFEKIGCIVMEYHLGKEDSLKKLLELNRFNVEISRFTEKSGLLFAYKADAINKRVTPIRRIISQT